MKFIEKVHVRRTPLVLAAIAFLAMQALMLTANDAEAAAPREQLPVVLSATNLVLGSVQERIAAKPGMLASAVIADDAQIAVLMQLLQQLIAIYQGLLAQQGRQVVDDNQGYSPTGEPSIQILDPNGGETYVTGESTIRIRYASSGIEGQTVTAYLYSPTKNNTRSVLGYVTAKDVNLVEMNLGKGGLDDTGPYKITLCAHAVQRSNGKDLCDSSDNYFTLTNTADSESASVKVTSPNGGEAYVDGDNVSISWAASAYVPVNIELVAMDSGNTFFIKQNYLPSGAADKYSLGWTADGEHQAQKDTRFKIRICISGTSTCDKSDSSFTILPVGANIPLQVKSPNGGETYTNLDTIPVEYTSYGITGTTLTAYLYHPVKGYVRTVRAYAENDGEIDIILAKGDSEEEPGQYKITLCALEIPTDGKNLCDSSDDYFTLRSAQ